MFNKKMNFGARFVSVLFLVPVIIIFTVACNQPVNETTKSVKVGVKASMSNESRSNNINYLIASGDKVTTISSYKVIFKKVEIGNSETDKFTLWEDNSGDEKDIVNTISFTGTKEIKVGTYKYVRLTIGNIIKVTGAIKDNTTDYKGSGTGTLSETVYLWGTDILNLSGEKILTNEINISADCDIEFDFNIVNTVTYLDGTSDKAILGVQKPVMKISVLNK